MFRSLSLSLSRWNAFGGGITQVIMEGIMDSMAARNRTVDGRPNKHLLQNASSLARDVARPGPNAIVMRKVYVGMVSNDPGVLSRSKVIFAAISSGGKAGGKDAAGGKAGGKCAGGGKGGGWRQSLVAKPGGMAAELG
eukprot:gene9143-biopygen3968